MALVIADIGADAILKAYFTDTRPANPDLTIKLFVTDVTPVDTHTNASYTEAAGGGYVSKTLTTAVFSNGVTSGWTVTVGNDPSDAVYSDDADVDGKVIWTFTGALTTNPTIYGYWVVDNDGTLIFAEKLTTSFTPANNGDQLKVTVKIQASKGTPA